MSSYTKDPAAVLDYRIDWAAPPPIGPWLTDGDTIAASSWTVAKGDVVINSVEHTATTTTVWLSGGTASTVAAKVTNSITTAGGRTDERTLTINVREK